MIVLPPKIDIDSGDGLFLLPFAKRQLARFKKLLPSGKRHWTLPSGEEVTIWWGLMRDRIKIVAALIGMSRAFNAGASEGLVKGFRRIKGESQIIETKIIDSGLPFLFSFIADWSKNGKTFVSVANVAGDGLQTATIIREGSTLNVPGVRVKYGVPSKALGTVIGTGEFWPAAGAFEISGLWHDAHPPRTDIRISANGNRVVFRSTIFGELFKVANWNEDTNTFNITSIGYPQRYIDLLNQYFEAGAIQEGATDAVPEGVLANHSLFQGIGFAFAIAVHPIGWFPVIPLYTTKTLVLAFQVGTYTTASNVATGSIGSLWRVSGTINTVVMSYNVDTGAWDTLYERVNPIVIPSLRVGSASATSFVNVTPENVGDYPPELIMTCSSTGNLLIHEYQRRSYNMSPVAVQMVNLSGGETGGIAPTPLPSVNTLSPTPFLINSKVISPDTGGFLPSGLASLLSIGTEPSSALLRNANGIWSWRYGIEDSQRLDLPAGSTILSPSGHWAFGGVISNLKVYHDGIQIWDPTIQTSAPQDIVIFREPSADHDGELSVGVGTPAPNFFLTGRMVVSFSPNSNGIYQAHEKRRTTVFNDFLLHDECIVEIL
jgi:hypothetical protein